MGSSIEGDTGSTGSTGGPSLYEHFMNLWRQSSAYLFGSAANRAIAIILIPMYTRYLTPDDYGVFAILMATMTFASVVMKLGMPGAFIRFYVDEDEEGTRGEILSSSLLFTAIWALLILILLLPMTGLFGKSLLGREGFGALFALAFATGAIDSISAILLTRFRARGKAKRYVAFTLARFFSRGWGFPLVYPAIFQLGVNFFTMAAGGLLRPNSFLKKFITRSLMVSFWGSSFRWLLVICF